ncbi:MAG TPA: hypothetical protein VMV44_15630 [Rectinemataceae bacterium]|nr:hypothetical protein [Rectinemataceae bacterium]
MATKVGKYLISTVGDYFPMNAEKREEIGYKRFYETMVFKAGKPCKADGCRCGMPAIDGQELDFAPYNTAEDAQEGHLAMCEKYEASHDR